MSTRRDIIAYITDHPPARAKTQREQVEAALAEFGATALEITDDYGRVLELSRLSNVGLLVVPSLSVINRDPKIAYGMCRDLFCKYRTRTVTLEE